MENWISRLKNKNTKLKNIKIPGTHHSAVDSITMETQVPNFKMFSNYLCKGIAENMSITQEFSIYEQLRQGIRFLDLRTCWVPGGGNTGGGNTGGGNTGGGNTGGGNTGGNTEGELYIAHTFTTKKTLMSVFEEIISFNNLYPLEPVLIRISVDVRNFHEYHINYIKANSRLTQVKKILKDIIYTGDNPHNASITEVQNTGKCIILVSSMAEIPYISTGNVEKKFNNIFNYYPKLDSVNKFSLVDIALTPGFNDMIFCKGSSLQKLADRSKNFFLDLPGSRWYYLNCITTDFPDLLWIERVIDLN
jgi:hypothetical protein